MAVPKIMKLYPFEPYCSGRPWGALAALRFIRCSRWRLCDALLGLSSKFCYYPGFSYLASYTGLVTLFYGGHKQRRNLICFVVSASSHCLASGFLDVSWLRGTPETYQVKGNPNPNLPAAVCFIPQSNCAAYSIYRTNRRCTRRDTHNPLTRYLRSVRTDRLPFRSPRHVNVWTLPRKNVAPYINVPTEVIDLYTIATRTCHAPLSETYILCTIM